MVRKSPFSLRRETLVHSTKPRTLLSPQILDPPFHTLQLCLRFSSLFFPTSIRLQVRNTLHYESSRGVIEFVHDFLTVLRNKLELTYTYTCTHTHTLSPSLSLCHYSDSKRGGVSLDSSVILLLMRVPGAFEFGNLTRL